ncbi:MAG: cysteine desulfurase [Anaerolineae bacterium]|nr:cysteine desulfurase [Anaerolineae bacterium]
MLNIKSVYLDHAATTPVDSRVLEAMLPYFSDIYGNPSAIHRLGRAAESAVEEARERVAQVLNCQPGEIVFTSCGSESDNLALRGVLLTARQQGRGQHLITTPIEHSAVSKTAHQLADLLDFALTVVPVDQYGRVNPADVEQAIRPDTALISIMYANNEVGTIQPIRELAALARERGVLFHTDAVQAAGQLPLDVQDLGVDLLAISAHKFYGPKGIGALYVRDGVQLAPSQSGGGQEHGLRAGTHNVAFIVGLATALELAYTDMEAHNAHYRRLRDRLIDGILASVPDARLTGHPAERLPNNASFAFQHTDGNALLMHLDLQGIAASSGSACKVGNPEPSSVLLSMGFDAAWAGGGLRLTVGRQTADDDMDYVLRSLPDAVARVRKLGAQQV